MIRLFCWGCGYAFDVADPIAGTVVRCPHCGVLVPVETGRALREDEWLTSTDLDLLLSYACTFTGVRKWRLFACACCRLVWDLVTDEASRQAVAVTERYADGQASWEELQASVVAIRHVQAQPGYFPREAAVRLVRTTASVADWECGNVAHLLAQSTALARIDRGALLQVVHDLFGNPFRPVTVPASWLLANDGAAKRLARSIYEERAFERLPILADALEDAGCAEDRILDHCRRPAGHWRGCWVVDEILAPGESRAPTEALQPRQQRLDLLFD
jgi:hypothetical protein